MATLEELVVTLTAETSELKSAMNTAVKVTADSSEKMEKSIKEFTENSSKNTSFFQQTMSTMTGFLAADAMKAVLNFATSGIGFLKDALLEGVDAAAKQEQATVRLANSMQLAGNYSAKAVSDMSAFANQMEEITGVGDDAVLSNLAYLSSLTKLSSEGLIKAEKAALDLASATGIDLNAAVTMVAKGIEGNVGAFKKYGITIEEGGSKTENFNNVIEKLNKSFGGAAEGNLKTYSGAVTGVQNAFGNLAEAFSSAVVNNEVVVAALSSLGKVLNTMAGDAEGSGNVLKEAIGGGLVAVIKITMLAVETVDVFARTFEASLRLLILPINAVADSLRLVTDILDGTKDDEAFVNTKNQFNDFQNALAGDTTLSKIQDGLIEVLASSEAAFQGMDSGAAKVKPTIEAAGNAVAELTALQIAHKEEVKAFAEELIKVNTSIIGNYEGQAAMLQTSLEMKLISEETYFANSLAALQTKQEAEDAALEEWRATNLGKEAEYNAAKTALEQRQTLETMKELQKRKAAEELLSQQKFDIARNTFAQLASIGQTGSREINSIVKASAVAQATMDTYAAATAALKNPPGPPYTIPLAAATVAAGLANVSRITGTGLATGIDRVPGVGTRDNFPAMLQPGERVVPKETNQDLSSFLDNQSSSGQNITVNINIPNPIPLNREASESMVEALNNYFQSGGLRLITT